jgi:acyl-CoA synthetase (AMP-forming)/AMP-acid ligase II
LCGAEVIAPSVLRGFAERFERHGFRAEALTPVYGLAEAALAVTFSDERSRWRSVRADREALAEGRYLADPAGIELVSVGRPVAGFRVEVRDRSNTPLPEGHLGRVVASGPSLMIGYLDRPAATRRVLHRGWLDTGDLGFLLGGELYLTGRTRDLLIVRGRNHAPESVEFAAAGVRGVRPGGVVAVSHRGEQDASEQVLLFAECERHQCPGHDATVGALRASVLSATGLSVSTVRLLAPGQLPRTTSGKLRRGETLRRYLAGSLREWTPLAAPGEPRERA